MNRESVAGALIHPKDPQRPPETQICQDMPRDAPIHRYVDKLKKSMPQKAYSSVKTRIQGYVRRRDPAATVPLSYGMAANEIMQVQDMDGTAVQQHVRQYLQAINAKLDVLLGMHTQKRLEHDFDYEVDIIELSAAGACFYSRTPYQETQDIEMALVLAQCPIQVAMVMGRLTGTSTKQGVTVFHLQFTHIRDSDKEAIVRFVFQEEREQIRQKKWGEMK